MTRWLSFLFAAAALALPALAGAVGYTFPTNMPPGCSGSNGTYTCPSGSLGYGDTVAISGTKPATITFTGNFSTDTSQINQSGAATDLNLIVNGTLTLGYQAKIKANITANSVNDAGGGGVVITGNLTANSGGSISLAYQTTVSGNVSTSGAGTITTPQSGSIGGNVSAGTGAISISEAGTVTGSVTSSGNITVVQNATVSGNLSTTSGTVDLGFQSKVNGNLSSTGAITTGQSSIVGGNITGGTGNVSIGYGATVTGTLTTSSGTIGFAQSAKAQACVKSTSSASITLGYQSTIHSVCCGSSCSSSCVVNNSTYAMPALCTGSTTLVADYRMDELTAWSGATGEVKDSSGNAYNATAATASSGTPTATTASGSPAVGNTTAGSCGYGFFNRTTPAVTAGYTYVQLPGSFPSMTTSFTVVGWIRSTNVGQSGQRIIANDDAQNGWSLSLGDAGSGRLRFFNRNVTSSGSVTGSSAANNACSHLCLDSAAVIGANAWHYVALLVDTTSKTVQILVYDTGGTLLASASSAYTGTWTVGSGTTSLGGESINSSEGTQTAFHFNGHIDELQVYTGLLDTTAIAMQRTRSRTCPLPAITSFTISGTGSASTCTPQTLTITAKDSNGATLTNYTGTINLSTSTGNGDWTKGSGPTPAGTLTPGTANSGLASYTFAAGDSGVVKLQLAHNRSQNVTVTVVDNAVSASSSTSAAINYRDNAFVWTEDASGLIRDYTTTPTTDLLFVAVAGRPHDMQLSAYKKDATTGTCSVATDYTGSKALKIWRTDNNGAWTTPTIMNTSNVTLLGSVPTARPASNNLTLTFTAGVASFNLGTTDIGKYAFSVDDDSLSYAVTTISGTSPALTVRPFTLAVTGITSGSTSNPGNTGPTGSVFGKAGAAFSATVTAYRWSITADANNDGVPDAGATLSQVSAAGVTPSFNTSVTLTPLANSQTPTATVGGVLGTLSNSVFPSFSAGTATTSSLSYSEVGSFALNTASLATNYLSTGGVNLDATVFNASGNQQTRVGRFIPAGFAATAGSPNVVHRVDQNCSAAPAVASTFTYLDEHFTLGFTLTAQNLSGATTLNYTDTFARLDLNTAANFNLAGVATGSTMFKTGNSRLSVTSSTGSWSSGVASGIVLKAKALRTTTPDGPFNADFGILPTDPDGVTMMSLDLDTDVPANGVDRTKVGTIPLRFGRLRLQNGMGAANRPLNLPLEAQYWSGTAYSTNALDSCTRISATNLSFGNLRRTLAASDAAMVGGSVMVAGGKGNITLAAPAAGHVGTLDVALLLDTATPPTDTSCLKSQAGWTVAKAATAGASQTALRGLWCGSGFADPGARATWGLYRGADGVIYQRENY